MAERTLGWPSRLTSIASGGDYNPEQWDEDVWAEDVRLMHEAGVNLLTVNVFGRAEIEPAPGRYDFDRLDRVMDMLPGPASTSNWPPGRRRRPWFSHSYPTPSR